jgi:hypothetical protein
MIICTTEEDFLEQVQIVNSQVDLLSDGLSILADGYYEFGTVTIYLKI